MAVIACTSIAGWINDDVFFFLAGFAVGFSVALALAATQVVQPTRYEETLLEALGVRGMARHETERREKSGGRRVRWRLARKSGNSRK